MKKILSLCLTGAFVCGAFFNADAKIWRLNNNNGGTINPAINAHFTGTLQAAHDNASVLSGDTIHVEQSNTSYGPLTMTKRLVIIGPGYFLSENAKTQVNTSYGATMGNLYMTAPSCAGSVVTGMTISANAVQLGANRLTLVSNNISIASWQTGITIGSGSAVAIDSIVIRSNWLNGPASGAFVVGTSGTSGQVTRLDISNNFFSYPYGTFAITLAGNYSGIIKNNVFSCIYAMSVSNMYVVNNIHATTSNSAYNTFNNSVIEYNLGYRDQQFNTPTGGNNTINTASNPLTNNFLFQTTGSTDEKLQLQPGSPAKGAGKSGEDMGMFGGTLPYTLSGMPAVPSVYAISIAPIAAGASAMSVTVSAKSN